MKNLFLSNKDGQARSWFTVIIFLVTFAIVTLISYAIVVGLKDGFTAAGFWNGTLASTGEGFLRGLRFFDKLSGFFVIVFIIGAATTTFRLASGPTFYVILFVQAAAYGFMSYIFNLIFLTTATNSVFDGIRGFFPLTMIICTNLHWVMLALIVVGSIAMFGKKEKGQFLT